MTADLEFAHLLADAADAITTARFRALDLRVETKPDLTPVSEADRTAEEAIRALVASSGRGEGVLGEELGDDGGDVRWIVDPIDGTRNYVRGVPVWATLLALEREGEVVLGLVSAPELHRRWWALRGEGAFANGEPCRVSAVSRLEDASVSTTSARGMPAGWRAIVDRSWSNRGLGDFCSNTQPVVQSLAIRSRESELGSVSQHDDRIAGEPRLYFYDPVDVHNVAPVDADERARVELRLDARGRHANEMTRSANVQADVITIRLPPIDVRGAHDLENTVHLHRDAVEWLTWRCLLRRRDVVGDQRAHSLVVRA